MWGKWIAILFLSFLVVVIIYFLSLMGEFGCNDGTLDGLCSSQKPYFCYENKLIEHPVLCGCPDTSFQGGGFCLSRYRTGPKDITLNYILDGDEGEINFTLYQGMANYLSKISQTLPYDGESKPSREDFKLRSINEPEQRELLLPLVTLIRELTTKKEDQFRIAVSLVQNIPFGESEKKIYFGSRNVTYSRHPYEVLYDMQGVCGEKSELLAFLLKELGYEVVFFYFNPENHEALGVKCPFIGDFGDLGYCFIETSGASIITDGKIEYAGGIKLISKPEILFISEGRALGFWMSEYRDARSLIRIRNSLEDGKLNALELNRFNFLKEKYGLEEVYNI